MKKLILSSLVSATALMSGPAVSAATCDSSYYSPKWDAQAPQVDAYNYVRAETDIQFKGYAQDYKAFGKFAHSRQAYDVDNQVTLSGNRDTIYSFGIFDLSKSPLTITLPDPNGRYMSMMVMSQNHDINPALYAPQKATLTEKEVGTRYIFVAIRTFADPNSKEDMERAVMSAVCPSGTKRRCSSCAKPTTPWEVHSPAVRLSLASSATDHTSRMRWGSP